MIEIDFDGVTVVNSTIFRGFLCFVMQPNLIVFNKCRLNKNPFLIEIMFDFAVEIAFCKVKIIGGKIDFERLQAVNLSVE